MRKIWISLAIVAGLSGALMVWLLQPAEPDRPAVAEAAPAQTEDEEAKAPSNKVALAPVPMPVAVTAAVAAVLPPLNCLKPSGDVLVVGEEPVTAAAFCAELAKVAGAQPEPMTPSWRDQAKLLRQQWADAMLVRKALTAEGGAITDEQVDAALGERLAALPKGTSAQLDAAATALVRQQLRARLELSKLLQLRGQGLVSDAELLAAYQADPARFGQPAVAVVVPYLLRLPKTMGKEEFAEARAKAEQFVAAVSKGEAPDAAAKTAGMNAMPKAEMSQGSGEDELVAAALKLSAGQWSAPMRTSVGWAVAQVLEVRPGVVLPFDQVREQVKAFVQGKQGLADRERALADLRAATRVTDRVSF